MILGGRSCEQKERGVAIIELALILPVILAIIFGALEVARALRVAKMVSSLSREAANFAFRECSPVWEDIQPCIDNVRAQSSQFADPAMENVQVIVSVYRWNRDTDSAEEVAVSPQRGLQQANRDTQVCISGCSRPLDDALLADAGLIAVAEVYADFRPLVPVLPPYLWFSPERIYEITYF